MRAATPPPTPQNEPWLAAVLVQASQAHSAGDLDAAESGYRQVLGISPGEPNALHLLGLVLGARGRPAAGRALIQRAIEATPDCAFFHSNLGNLLQREGQFAAAVEAYHRAIALDPDLADAHANLAGALCASTLFVGAEIAAERALELSPQHPIALANLAGARIGQLQFESATEPLEEARRIAPHLPEVWLNTGHQRMAETDFCEAEVAFRNALELAPNMLEAKKGLGFALVRRSKLSEARELLEAYTASCDRPNNAHTMLGHILTLLGDHEAGVQQMRLGLSRQHASAQEHSTFLFDLNYCPALEQADILDEHRKWSDRFGISPKIYNNDLERDPDRRLRIGFVSPDFYAHSVSFFFLPLLEAMDRERCETVCYSNVRDADRITLALQEASDEWREIWGVEDREVAQMIREDRIDILVDLAGHSANNRLGVFRYKPAPIQVNYLGYPNTTGLATMDARLVDDWTDPEGVDDRVSEALLRLPRCFLAYRPDAYPAIAEPPAIKNGYVTFGSFNNMAKVNDLVIDVWAKLLTDVAESRLVLKHDTTSDPGVRQRIFSEFSARGVDPGRITLLERAPHLQAHLELYHHLDVALDTFPYNGTTTTCEALWMGVPVVTLAGDVHAARVGASLLSAIGFGAGIAQDAEEYCSTAATLAANPAMLSTIRTMLRETMTQSPLCDADGLAQAVETELRALWRSWCSVEDQGELL